MVLLKYLQQEGPVHECGALEEEGDRAGERVREASSCAQQRAGECEGRPEAQCYSRHLHRLHP